MTEVTEYRDLYIQHFPNAVFFFFFCAFRNNPAFFIRGPSQKILVMTLRWEPPLTTGKRWLSLTAQHTQQDTGGLKHQSLVCYKQV